MTDVERKIKWSSELFLQEVWPMIVDRYKLGQLMVMEGRADAELAKMLDMRSGIDGWELTRNGGMRGIASRVQVGQVWRSFTVRYRKHNGQPTEYTRHKNAIQGGKGLIYPHITVQAYAETEKGPVNAIGICQTSQLIEYIDRGLHSMRSTSNADFAVCYWWQMLEHGYAVHVIDNTGTNDPF